MKDIDKYRGCLIGGAAGDALGYEVEFLDESAIFSRFGERGITEYALRDGVARDDMARGAIETYTSCINNSYKDWYRTQTERYPLPEEYHYSWLVNVPEMFSRRAPGITCLSAIENPAFGKIEEPTNDSKGCGGVMRVAPVGLYFEGKGYSIEEIDMMGAETAALTHGHSLGYIPAAGLVHIIHLLSHNDDITIPEAVEDMKKTVARLFAGDKHLQEFLKLIDRAMDLSKAEDIEDPDAVRELGQG